MRQTIVCSTGALLAAVWLAAPFNDRWVGASSPAACDVPAPVATVAMASIGDDAPTGASTDAPTTAPSTDAAKDAEGPKEDPDRRGDRRGRSGDRPGRGDGAPGISPGTGGPGMGGPGQGRRRPFPGPGLPTINTRDAPNDEEWGRIAEFWRDNAPSRFAAFQEFERDLRATGADLTQPGPYQMVRRSMAWRFRMYDALVREQQDMAPFALDQLRTEDQAFAVYRDLRGKANDPELTSKFRELTATYVETSIKEREKRIEALKDFMRLEELRLEQDRAGRDKLVSRQEDRFRRQFEMILARPTTQPTK